MKPTRKNLLLAVGSVLVIAGSGLWIYYREFKAPKYNVPLHQRVGEVLAEETAKAVGPKGHLMLITIPTSEEPELATQLDAFHQRLKKLGNYELKDHELDTKDQPKYGIGTGLSARRFVRAVKNHPEVDAIVSFVGAPHLKVDDFAELKRKPKFIAESRSPDYLPELFASNVLQVAVVSRFVFPAPGPTRPKNAQQWFDKRYQVIDAAAMKANPPE